MNTAIVTHADRCFETLRHQIIEGMIPASSKLNEASIAEDLGVSRAVVRESINRLEACHLVTRIANKGASVVALSNEGLSQLYLLRESLEGMAARLAAVNMSDSEVSELSALLDLHATKVQLDNHYYQEAGDLDFHYRIILGSKNQYLIDLLTNSIYHLIRMYRVQLGMSGPRITNAFNEHRNITDAIAHRDGELAELLMRRHISYSRKSIERNLQNKEGLI